MHSYNVSGLAVLSEMDLPGLIAYPPGTPDVSIRLGAVPPELEGAEGHPTYQIAGDDFLLRIPDVARFLLHAGREITVEPLNGTPLDDVAIFILGTVFGILLHQRGQMVLHASAVCVGGKAVLFCGSSGAGKSTIAAALGQCGYPLLTDDVCALEMNGGGGPMVQPDGRQLKLWAHAIDKLDLGERRGAPVRSHLEKFYVESQGSIAQALPLGAVYALRERRPPNREGIERPNIVDAVRLIRNNAYRPRLVRVLRQTERYLRASSAMIIQSGVFVLTRPLDFAAMPDVVKGLEAHWRELGLLGDGS